MKVWSLFVALLGLSCLTGTQTALGAEKAAESIDVGVTLALSGEYAELGQAERRGMQMWVDDLNARGELLGRKVKLVVYDDKSDPQTSARLYARLIQDDKVDLLLGPYSSPITFAASAVTEKYAFPMVATGAAAFNIWSRGYQNIFQIDSPAAGYMDLPLEFAHEKGLHRVAVVHQANNFSREVAAGARAKAETLGMEIVFDEEYPAQEQQFGALVGRMQQTGPDMIIGGTYIEDSVALTREIRRAGLAPKILVLTVGPALKQFGKELGKASEAVMGTVAWMRSGRMPMAYDFSFRYKEKYGRNAGVHAAYGYAGGQVLEAAVRLAGSLDKDKIRDQLRTMKFRSILGHYRVDATGKQIAKKTLVMQWQQGYRLLVLPKRFADTTVQYPFAP